MTVSVVSNSRIYGVRFRERAAALPRETGNAMIRMGFDAKQVAVKLSSGTLGSPATLRALGHPYSRRAPVPVGPKYPAMINVNTGRFRSAWYFTFRLNSALKDGGQAMTVTLRNDSEEAKYLTAAGTSKMIGRPIQQAIIEAMRPVQAKALAAAKHKAIGAPVRANVPDDVLPATGPGESGDGVLSGFTGTNGGGASFNPSGLVTAFNRGLALGTAAGVIGGEF